ncbi:hypothetical protein QJS04_geneDACA018830 [Acorus gramineus]|uniref:Uncharacterized protein n=1 Tax=Acorus gramineus TaxID=55184 RepID=A0AAV9BQ99_ACOGR|nr:hypothetical protein QJS04_geneDACA018830 [Acorus gramineus]
MLGHMLYYHLLVGIIWSCGWLGSHSFALISWRCTCPIESSVNLGCIKTYHPL